ncbi:flagellar hook-associated protein FlgK [Undibacterium sp. LX40W]|uniref:Flagellar hook-associated protein 1 n=1 Tax=Undibacterium nitidum TaxID=2762298 RepID=A0A923HKQ3_9BURK|nr:MULTISPECIES: flagellar hook-associated protein FlgK [Undibacterium]MBC3880138.1 flagellar hook-associated protein FlgK [Undibacterium nitidum]MBC3891126.1 flagellar hook-associated protein FlgK [Undibacterium sp. LX40W]
MGTSILGIGQSALAAAQMGIATTGHNIANANTPGYSRQVLLQSAAAAQNDGGSFIGQGTKIGEVKRIYNEFIGQQVNVTQSAQNYSAAYLNQVQRINNLVADQTAGISPSLQEFFSAIQNLASTPNGTAGSAARQSVLSTGAALTTRLAGLGAQLDQVSEEVNSRISQTITDINGYAKQISQLNDSIETAESISGGATPNDLLDQRDYAVTQLSRLVNVTVVEQSGKFNIFMGTGQPLVLGAKVSVLQPTSSLTDPSRIQASYESNGTLIQLNEKSITGGELGGLFAFRTNSLDASRNSIGRISIAIATEFNAQHKLGQDLNGQIGNDFFSIAGPSSTPSSANTGTANIAASFADVGALTLSDYRVQYLAGTSPAPNYFKITRLSDGNAQTSNTLPAVIDGITFNLKSSAVLPAVNDEFLVKPTAAGASSLRVAISDVSKIAAGTPLSTTTPATNLGTGKITPGVIDAPVAVKSNSLTASIGSVVVADSYLSTTLSSPLNLSFASAPNSLAGFPVGALVSVTSGGVTSNYEVAAAAAPSATPPKVVNVPYTSGATVTYAGISFVIKDNPTAPTAGETFTLASSTPVTASTLTYNSVTNSFSGFPATANVTVKNGNTTTSYVAGAAIPYVEGSTISYNGLSFVVSGAYRNGDVINISNNASGTGDNRNAVLLAGLQTKNTMSSGSTSFQGAYGQFVSLIGNKAHELEVTNSAETKLLDQALQAQQAESGVNLDEEAANLLRYQQAYQAAGKLMQIASQLFDALLALGR